MVEVKLKDNECIIVKELIQSEKASLKVIDSKKLPKRLERYRKELLSLENKVSRVNSL